MGNIVEISTAWWNYILHATLQTSIVAAIVLAVVLLCRRIPSHVRYALLFVALLKFAFPPFFGAPTGLFNWLNMPVPLSAPGGSARSKGPIHIEDWNSEGAVPAAGNVRLAQKYESIGTPAPSWKSWLMLIHGIGAVAALAWIVHRSFSLQRLRAGATEVNGGKLAEEMTHTCESIGLIQRPVLALSRKVECPVVFGPLRPTVLFPSNAESVLSIPDVRTVLAHELLHIKRGDLWAAYLEYALLAIWWFNPIYWFLHWKLRQAREDCCDDALLARRISSNDSYCDTLLRVARLFRQQSGRDFKHAFLSRYERIGARLVRISDLTLPRSDNVSIRSGILICAIALIFVPGESRSGRTLADSSAVPSLDASQESLIALIVNDSSTPNGPAPSDRDTAENAGDRLVGALQAQREESNVFLISQLQDEIAAHTPDTIQAVIGLLGSYQDHTRLSAASVLGEIGAAAHTAVGPLIGALRAGNANAGLALAKIAPDSKDVVEAMVRALPVSGTPNFLEAGFQFNQVRALQLLGPRAEPATGKLNEILMGRNPSNCAAAAAALGAIGSEEAMLALEEALDHPFLSVQISAAEALERNGHVTPKVVSVVEFAIQSDEGALQTRASTLLGKGRFRSHLAVPLLLKVLKAGTEVKQTQSPASPEMMGKNLAPMMAANALGNFGESAREGVPVLVKACGSSDSKLRIAAARALGRIDPLRPEPVSVLIAELDNPNSGTSGYAAQSLGDLGNASKVAVPALRMLLVHRDAYVRFSTARALWQITKDSTEIVPVLSRILEQNRAMIPAIDLLAEIGPLARVAAPTLRRSTESRRAKHRAERALAKIVRN